MVEKDMQFSRKQADALAEAMREHELAEAEKAKAEAAKAKAEKKLSDLEFERSRLSLECAQLGTKRELMRFEQDKQKFEEWRASDVFHHAYYFTEEVGRTSVARCMAALDYWARTDIEPQPIRILFNSPGGDVVAGFALFDHIMGLRRKGHKFTTYTEGMAASMAGILLQAGDVRSMGEEAWVLIHRAAFLAMGKTFEVEDEVKWVKRIEARIIDIFVKRAQEAKSNGTATHPLTPAVLKKNWDRKDWWLTSDECLKYGVVDVLE